MSTYEQTEGITLQIVPYRDREKILTLFTKKLGIISTMVRGISQKKPALFPLLSPFCLAEFTLKKTKTDLFSFIEGNKIDEHLGLRTDFSYLKAAGMITQALLKSHFPHQKASDLYDLYKAYIQKIPTFTNPYILLHSFRLKFLLHEGLIHLFDTCNVCKEKALYIDSGETVCEKHTSCFGIRFSEKEMKSLFLLTYLRSFSLLQEVVVDEELEKKISDIFQTLA